MFEFPAGVNLDEIARAWIPVRRSRGSRGIPRL